MNATIKPTSRLLQIRRVAGERGQGAASLYAFGYADLAELLDLEPLAIARLVIDERLEPLNLPELALARRHGVDWIADCGGDATLASSLRALRPAVVSEVTVAHPPAAEQPPGLDTLWAITYAELGRQLGLSPAATRNAAKGERKALDIRSLASVLDYVEARHPLIPEAA